MSEPNPAEKLPKTVSRTMFIVVVIAVAIVASGAVYGVMSWQMGQQQAKINALDASYSSLYDSYIKLSTDFYGLSLLYNSSQALLQTLQSASTTNASLGLTLNVALSTVFIQPPEQGISITISETNILNSTNTVSAATEWPFSPLSLGSCGVGSDPIELAVFQGYYTFSNISTAMELDLYQPGTYLCPPITMGSIAFYIFQPLSDMAFINSSNPGFGWPMNYTVMASGYYLGTDVHNFSPGIYTVVGGDEWGQLVLLHFVVV